MEDKNRKILVKNRSAATVIVEVPNRNIRVVLQPGQVISNLTFGDVEEFSYIPGGDTILREYLQLSEADINNLNIGKPELEYNYSEKDIVDLMKSGSLDAFLDCLDFAPTGVIDLIKKFAVDLPLTDTEKLDALKEKTGFDAVAAIRHKKEEEEDNAAAGAAKPTRRVTTEQTTTPTTGRRVIKK